MRLKKLWIILLSLSLWTTTTRAQVATANPDEILGIGAPALYSGVLISPAKYRQLSIDQRENQYLSEYLSKHDINYPTIPTVKLFSIDGYALVVTVGAVCFMGGLILGLRL